MEKLIISIVLILIPFCIKAKPSLPVEIRFYPDVIYDERELESANNYNSQKYFVLDAIADVHSESISADLRSQLNKIQLTFQVSSEQASGKLTRDQIIRDLHASDFFKKYQNEFEWHIQVPEEISWKSAKESDWSDKSFIKRLTVEFNRLCEGCEFEWLKLQTPAAPSPKAKWRLLDHIHELPHGSFAYSVQVVDSSKSSREPQKTLWLMGSLRILKQVAIAKRSLQIGEEITEDNISFQNIDMTMNRGLYLDLGLWEQNISTSSFLNFSRKRKMQWLAKRNIASQEKILMANLKPGPYVRSHQNVLVVKKGDDWEVQSEGQSQNSAFSGEQVTVRIASSNKLVTGRVDTDGRVVLYE